MKITPHTGVSDANKSIENIEDYRYFYEEYLQTRDKVNNIYAIIFN